MKALQVKRHLCSMFSSQVGAVYDNIEVSLERHVRESTLEFNIHTATAQPSHVSSLVTFFLLFIHLFFLSVSSAIIIELWTVEDGGWRGFLTRVKRQ